MKLSSPLKILIRIFLSDLKDLLFHLSPKDQLLRELCANGYITFPNFLKRQECEALKSQVFEVIRNPALIKGKTFIDKRDSHDGKEKYDENFFDIMHIEDSLTPGSLSEISGFLLKILNRLEPKIKYHGANAYYTKNLKNPRAFHIDSPNRKQFKAFIYLMDVDEMDGPFSFIRKTHRFSLLRYLNVILNFLYGRPLTDMRFHPQDGIQKFTGEAGVMILSAQDGMHRGYPQSPDHERLVLVLNFSARETY